VYVFRGGGIYQTVYVARV